jgi:phenylacetate-CoA ligase
MALIFKAEDLAKGTKINSFYSEYRSYLYNDITKIKKIQQKKLNLLIEHVWHNIPWYKKQLINAGYNPGDKMDNIELKKLPVLNRYDIQENLDQLLWKDYKGKIFEGSSSGTTGTPIKYFKDINGISAGIATGFVLMGLSGWRPGIRSIHVWGNLESIKQWNTTTSKIKQWIYSRKNIPSSLFNDPAHLKNIVEKIMKYKPVVIDGYSNSIYELAIYVKKHNIRIHTAKMVFTTAENLEDHNKMLIEEMIAPVSDMYGCGEINGIACKPSKSDKYYIYDPHVIVEAVNLDNNYMKEILVTDLDNFYMPLIRYKIGDLIDDVHHPSDSNDYPFCYFTKIHGRTSDHIILPNGKKIYPINIFGGTLYRKYSSIKRHKTIWNGEKLVFIFEILGYIDLEALYNDIVKSIAEYNVLFEIKTTDKIMPEANGKFRYFENTLISL